MQAAPAWPINASNPGVLELFPLSARVVDGELTLGGVAASALAAEHGTPLVVYCEETIRTQARAYRAARNLPDEATRIAVLVQRMVPAVTSGVAFTVNPVTGADELVVNSDA